MSTAPLTRARPLPKRMARNVGMHAFRPHRGYTLPEFARMLDEGRLDRRLAWRVYQVDDNVWRVTHGRDSDVHVLGQRELEPRGFKSCGAAMNAIREWIGATTFVVEVLPEGRVVASRGRADEEVEEAVAE